jgi:hypothetical protein
MGRATPQQQDQYGSADRFDNDANDAKTVTGPQTSTHIQTTLIRSFPGRENILVMKRL